MVKRRKGNPWRLQTPPLSSEYEMYFDEKDGKDEMFWDFRKDKPELWEMPERLLDSDSTTRPDH